MRYYFKLLKEFSLQSQVTEERKHNILHFLAMICLISFNQRTVNQIIFLQFSIKFIFYLLNNFLVFYLEFFFFKKGTFFNIIIRK